MTPSRFAQTAFLLTALFVVSATAQDSAILVPQVSRTVPVSTGARALTAERPISVPDPETQPRQNPSAPPTNNWKLLATLPGTIIHDLVFVSATVGYAAAEGGQVWKTTNGGKNWTMVLNLGYPYYFYGVAALSGKIIAVTGFLDTSTSQPGILRWSQDGGTTWSSDITITTNNSRLQRIRFANAKDGLIFDLADGSAQYTTDGGATASDWTTVVNNPMEAGLACSSACCRIFMPARPALTSAPA